MSINDVLKEIHNMQFPFSILEKSPTICVLWEPQVGSLLNGQGSFYRKGILQLLLHTISWGIHAVWSTVIKSFRSRGKI